MRADPVARTLRMTVLMAVMTAMSAGIAIGQTSPRNTVTHVQGSLQSGPKTVTSTRQPSGTPHKASSFAPHPTRRRAFGAPIQPPILKKVPPPKKTPQPGPR